MKLHDYCGELSEEYHRVPVITPCLLCSPVQAADTSIGWALGYMLNLSNMIPAESLALRKGMQFGAWVALLILFVLVILCSLLLLLQLLYRSKKEASVI